MPIIVACPSCGGKLRVADDLLGRKVRCPGCNGTFDAAAPEPNPSAQAPPPPLAPPPRPPRPERTPRRDARDDLKECPVCGRQVSRDSRRCYHCGERFDERDGRGRRDDHDREEAPNRFRRRGEPMRRDLEPGRGGLVLGLGIVSLVMVVFCPFVGVVFGLVAWVLGQIDLRKIKAGTLEPDGQGITQGGWICGIIGTALNGLLVLGCLSFYGIMYYNEVSSSMS